MNTTATLATIEVASDKEKELSIAIADLTGEVNNLVITNQDDYQRAAEFGRAIKQEVAAVKEFFKPLKDAAHKAHAAICEKEKNSLKPLERAEKLIKSSMSNYLEEQERVRKEAEERARKEAEAAMERKLNEAVALSEQGKVDEADAVLEEAEIMNSVASSLTYGDDKPKADGVSTKVDYEIVNIDASKVPIEVAGVEIRPVDTAAVMRLIRASKGKIKIKGIEYKEKIQMILRK